jgi:1-deoxy-D-xylulose-5-phosphate synthase
MTITMSSVSEILIPPRRMQPEGTASLLDAIGGPDQLRRLDAEQLRQLAAEIRSVLVEKVSRTGGHLGPNLGVVELTIALHRVFDSPRDTILWDTGHQTYVHKLVTGRQADFDRLRQPGGLSGYPCGAESEHDVIENSHASTALAWADGLVKAHQVRGVTSRQVVAVLGDGALTGGMAAEALNNLAAGQDRPVIIVLNDNGRSYAPTVGGLARHLAALRSAPRGRAAGAGVPGSGQPGNIFECLGLSYLGPVDGHDIGALEAALLTASDLRRPVVVHCLTEKGKGYERAERDETDRLHIVRAASEPGQPVGLEWTAVFADEMVALGAERPEVVAITAAMPAPVGLDKFARAYPHRMFDVGIAEQHAVTSAAAMAKGGLHPVVAVYATFLNRAFDQVLMDVALHRCGVTFVLDRAGVTGDDGPSHNGMWDLSWLQLIPGMRIAAPRDAASLRARLREAVTVADAPTVVRFPKGHAEASIPAVGQRAGVDVLFRSSPAEEADVLLVSVGSMASTCLEVAHGLAGLGISSTVVDPRWVKPVDPAVPDLAAAHSLVVTVEDNGRVGGVGCTVAQALRDADIATPVSNFGLLQEFAAHGKRPQILTDAGLTAPDLITSILRLLARSDVSTGGTPMSRLRKGAAA